MTYRIMRHHEGFMAPRASLRTYDEMMAAERGIVIDLAAVFEISLTPEPAYEGTAVWLADQGEYDLQPHVRALREAWNYGVALDPRARRYPKPDDPAPAAKSKANNVVRLPKFDNLESALKGKGRRAAWAVRPGDSVLMQELVGYCGWSRPEAERIEQSQCYAKDIRSFLAGPPSKPKPKGRGKQ
jgi:hypothetical protein